MTEALQARAVRRVVPRARLVAWTQDPYALAVASARTCYAADFVFVGRLGARGERTRMTLLDAFPDRRADLDAVADAATPHDRRLEIVTALQDVAEDPAARDAVAVFADLARQRAETDDRIARSIYEAGHHTPFQHPTFVFALEDVSRNVVESFFHQHMFYNSEQQSQRYVRMTEAEVVVPDRIADDPAARAVFEEAVGQAYDAYERLREMLVGANERTMAAIGRIKGQSDKQVRSEAEKKSQEMARYVVPVAAATRLYHTVSGIVLLRYLRMVEAQSAPGEARAVVQQMVEEVRKVDPAFLEATAEEPLAADLLPDRSLVEEAPLAPTVPLEGRTSVLLDATPHAEALVVRVLREVTGSALPDAELLRRVLDPGANRVWNDTLNTWDHSPLLRALRHVRLTFHKRQSLAAYAQDQRHRMTPATRPLLQRAVFGDPDAPDVFTPDVIRDMPEARALYDDSMRRLWAAMRRLRAEHHVPAVDCAYLLPNATNLYYTQSGDLLSYIHKWRLRLCFNAQKEIYEAALDELRQAQERMPGLTRWLGPPCSFVAAAQPPGKQDDVAACCPEGPRWCGVKVWKGFDPATGKPRRPY